MIHRRRFYHSQGSNPEGCVLDHINEWRDEHPKVVILGVQWMTALPVATCDVTYEAIEPNSGGNGEAIHDHDRTAERAD